MNKKAKIIFILLLIVIVLAIFALTQSKAPKQEDDNLKIVTSFYPIYIITTNITQNAQNVEVVNLTQNNVGCLHDYTLSVSDMKKIENANIFIENGLELESFMSKIINYNPNLKVINSSKEVKNIIQDGEKSNPHIWTSIENYISQVKTITKELCESDEKNSTVYTQNSEKYIEMLNELKQSYSVELAKLNGQKVICLNEALVYLANSINMECTNIETNHEESALSAETIKNIIEKMKAENIKIIFVAEEDNLANAQTLSNETGAKIYKLKSCLLGETGKDEYINSMKSNLEILKQIIKENR